VTIDHLTSIVLAIGSLGTAAYAMVDVSKAFFGGISNRGFGHIKRLAITLVPTAVKGSSPISGASALLDTLRANWINGTTPLAGQKSIAKTLIKVNTKPEDAARLAMRTGVDPVLLRSVLDLTAAGGELSTAQQSIAGLFDVQLSAMIDAAYQTADQSYRNSAKLLAAVFAVILALAGKWALGDSSISWGTAVLAGLLAAPFAPVSKDLASALQTSVRTLQALRR
jgi:hypothetical protein